MIAPARTKPDAPVAAAAPRTAFALVLLKRPGIEILAVSEDAGRIAHERAELEDATPGLEPENLTVLEAVFL